jgi:uracil phosphoribosyltransferase
VSVQQIKLLIICASMQGIRNVLTACPGVQLYIVAADSDLDKSGYILPGRSAPFEGAPR